MTFWDGNGWVNEVRARSKSTLRGHRVSLVALVIVGALAIGGLPLLVTGASPTLTISPTRAVGGVTVTLAGMGFVPLRSSWIGGAVVGGTILAYVPEWVRGKYLARA